MARLRLIRRLLVRFHQVGPFTSNPEFLLQTQAGHVLDPERVLVAVHHNFGVRLGTSTQAPGAILSIDPRAAFNGSAPVVPADLGSRATPSGSWLACPTA